MIFLELIYFGIVYTPPPPPPSNQQQCTYSVRENANTYKCYTDQEYQTMVNARKDASDKAIQELYNSVSSALLWLIHHWWQTILSVVGLVLAFFIASFLYDEIDMKRHPEKYDQYGFKKNDFWF